MHFVPFEAPPPPGPGDIPFEAGSPGGLDGSSLLPPVSESTWTGFGQEINDITAPPDRGSTYTYPDIPAPQAVEVGTTEPTDPLPFAESGVQEDAAMSLSDMPEPAEHASVEETPVDQEKIASEYSPEMTEARDKLLAEMGELSEHAKAFDARGDLPRGVRAIDDHPDFPGRKVVELGAMPGDVEEALAAFQEEQAMKAMDPDDTTPDNVWVEHNEPPSAEGPLPEDSPKLRVAWTRYDDGICNVNWVSVHHNGYVERGTHVWQNEVAGPSAYDLIDDGTGSGADDDFVESPQASLYTEVDIVPYATRPAETDDISEARQHAELMRNRYQLRLN
jgi:hypothetical protein